MPPSARSAEFGPRSSTRVDRWRQVPISDAGGIVNVFMLNLVEESCLDGSPGGHVSLLNVQDHCHQIRDSEAYMIKWKEQAESK